jgi:Chalcone isomerase-like
MLALTMLALAPMSVARAAELDGVTIPDTRVVDGVRMQLNGIGLRTYSVFRIHIYVAGLYLEQRSDSPDTILHSPEHKLLDIHFVRDVSAEDVRQAWREGFANNCRPPGCYLAPRDIERFLAAIPPLHKGDDTALFFSPRGVEVSYNGQPMGDIADPHFATTMLATFIGPVPPTPRLKRELLGSPQ